LDVGKWIPSGYENREYEMAGYVEMVKVLASYNCNVFRDSLRKVASL
jgi:hypothetical protein